MFNVRLCPEMLAKMFTPDELHAFRQGFAASAICCRMSVDYCPYASTNYRLAWLLGVENQRHCRTDAAASIFDTLMRMLLPANLWAWFCELRVEAFAVDIKRMSDEF